jgi:hypothetical protein
MYHVVKYVGAFGFIKPWTAVRDGETHSQQFLTPSMIEGIEKKLFPELLCDLGSIKKIARYRLNYTAIQLQQETTRAKGGIKYAPACKDEKVYKKIVSTGILSRGTMIDPHLYLAFEDIEDAKRALKQHICLCRNEDVMLPESGTTMTKEEFDEIIGFELIASDSTKGFKVGYNRFLDGEAMYGELKIYGNDPIRRNG